MTDSPDTTPVDAPPEAVDEATKASPLSGLAGGFITLGDASTGDACSWDGEC